MSEVNFHYAYTLGHIKDDTGLDKDLVLQKCFTSFLNSILYFAERLSVSQHTVGIFYKSYEQQDIFNIIDLVARQYHNKIKIEYHDVSKQGINGNLLLMEQGFHWLQAHGKQFVFNVQDNFLFSDKAVYEMFTISNQIKFSSGYDILAGGLNYFSLWLATYGDSSQIQVIKTQNNYDWVNYYSLSNSFMTTHHEFSQHWDVYLDFFKSKIPKNECNFDSLNLRLNKKLLYTIVPLQNLIFLIDSNIQDPFNTEWTSVWDSTHVTL